MIAPKRAGAADAAAIYGRGPETVHGLKNELLKRGAAGW